MKPFCLFFASFLWALQVAGKEVKLADFDIKASNANNSAGFIKLSQWLKGKSDITINFPKGVYIIGQQKSSVDRVVENTDNFLSIENCTRITIKGKGAKIKYAPNLLYGAFEVGSKKKLTHNTAFAVNKNAAYLGNCINILNSNQVTISDLELDGNNEQTIIGGRYGDVGIQLWHRGIIILNSYDIQINKVYIHHFCLDGLEIKNDMVKTGISKYQVNVSNVKCFYNGRDGISWTGGNGLYVANSEFSNTGKAKICSAPGAGMDIEPEVGPCQNGLFINCKFENNCGPAFVSDFHKIHTKDIYFNNCTFYGTTQCAVWANNAGITFKNSTIEGQILGPSGLSINEKTVFDGCNIYDYHINSGKKAFYTNFLIDAGGGQKFFEFTNSNFYLKYAKLCYVESGSSNETSMPIFKNNTAHFNHDLFTSSDFIAVFRGCIMQNNTFEINIKKIPQNGLYLVTGHTMKFIGHNTISGKNEKIGWNSPGGKKIISEK